MNASSYCPPPPGKFDECRRAPLTRASLILALLLLCLLAPAAARAADISNADFSWVESTGALTLHTNAGTTAWRGELTCVTTFFNDPDGRTTQYDAYSQVRSVAIGPGVTELGDSAFSGCDELVRADVPQGVARIGEHAFKFCRKLTTVFLPDSVGEIGLSAFDSCAALGSIDLPAGLRRIERYTFYYCLSLSAVSLPEGLEEIGNSAFYYCASLTSATVPETVKTIEDSAFRGSGLVYAAFEGMAAPSLDIDVFVGLTSLGTIYIPEGSTGYGTGEWPGPPVAYKEIPLPRFTVQPQSATLGTGLLASFTAAASNPAPEYPLRYQWQVSRDGGLTWADVPGAVGAAYTTQPLNAQMNGWRYRCRARNLGAVVSDAAALTVTAAPPPQPPPKTGDSARPALWAALGLLALAGLAALLRRRRRA